MLDKADYRCCAGLTRTGCGVKKILNTCPKISSSTTSATATEKTSPATTAMNVIAICISTLPLHALCVRSIEWQSGRLNQVVEKQGCECTM
jgi:hypothetical protein